MTSSLASRLALLLMIANAPAALLAVGAGIATHEQGRDRAEQLLTRQSELVAARAGLVFSAADGVMETLAANREIAEAGPRCGDLLQAALAAQGEYAGMLIANADAIPVCAAGEVGVTDRTQQALRSALAAGLGGRRTVFLSDALVEGDRFIAIAKLIPADEPRVMALIMHRANFDAVFDGTSNNTTMALVRPDGTLFAFAPNSQGRSGQWRPAVPQEVFGNNRASQVEPSEAGPDFFYATAPVHGTRTEVVVAAPVILLGAIDWQRVALWAGLPLLILAIAIIAVFIGVNRLVLRWVARMRQVTAFYAAGDYSPRVENLSDAPRELAELGAGLHAMADRVEERSQDLEEALEGKNGLLRELHHRVKNNFQMIASLLALQRRELPTRLRTLLRVPEDRVLAMASAYKASYASGEIGRVPLGDLLRDIAGQLRQSFGLTAPIVQLQAADSVHLDLDRAVPLGLLVSEIVTAALDRAGMEGRPIALRVLREDDDNLRVEIESEDLGEAVPSAGLAARLVQAYQAQLGARLAIIDERNVRISMSIEAPQLARPGRVELSGS